MRRAFCFPVAIFLLCAVTLPALAHAPLESTGNVDPASATLIPDPQKSWVIYTTLPGGDDARYYRFSLRSGERVHISLFTTASNEDADFNPTLVLMGPGVPIQRVNPGFVEIPPGSTAMAVPASRAPYATYEPFSPGALVGLSEITWTADSSGTFYLAVFDPDIQGGNFGIAIGDVESYTLTEWIRTPLALLEVYQWERQELALVLAPAALILVAGIFLLIRRGAAPPLDLPGWLGAVAGLLFLGTAVTVFTQMIFALQHAPPDISVAVTLLFMGMPLVLGLVTLRHVFLHARIWRVPSRISLILLGGIGLVIWGGWLAGPVLAVFASILPAGRR